jgi:hypothetical protein
MKIIKMTEKESNIEEMKEWFDQRTKKHIALVKKYCQKIKEYGNGEFDELRNKIYN